ncbi:MAG: tetraacyldisaccharide 4'-kinase [Fibrobacterota bacterium]
MFFRVLSWIYALASEARNLLFDRGVLKSRKLPVRVLSVGNITAGGAGKTPLTLLIGEILSKNNVPFGVLSRGYGRTSKRPFAVQKCNGLTAREIGDEPKMIGERLGCPLGIGADRFRIGGLLLRKFGPRTLLLDDGFSHRGLARDCDIVAVDGHNPFGKNFLPHGTRREALRRLARAHAFVITRNTAALEDADIRVTLGKYAPGRPVFTAERVPCGIVAPDGSEHAMTEFVGTPCYLFSGIADGKRFEETARTAGLTVTGCIPYSDHYIFDKDEIDHLRKNAGAGLFLTTEKDWWRLEGLREGLYYLRISLRMDDPVSFERFVVNAAT